MGHTEISLWSLHFAHILVNVLWHHELQWYHFCNKLIWVWECEFYWYTDCENFSSLIHQLSLLTLRPSYCCGN